MDIVFLNNLLFVAFVGTVTFGKTGHFGIYELRVFASQFDEPEAREGAIVVPNNVTPVRLPAPVCPFNRHEARQDALKQSYRVAISFHSTGCYLA